MSFRLSRRGAWLVVLVVAIVTGALGYQVRHFEIDASADTLLTRNNAKYIEYTLLRQVFAPEENAPAVEWLKLADAFWNAANSATWVGERIPLMNRRPPDGVRSRAADKLPDYAMPAFDVYFAGIGKRGTEIRGCRHGILLTKKRRTPSGARR